MTTVKTPKKDVHPLHNEILAYQMKRIASLGLTESQASNRERPVVHVETGTRYDTLELARKAIGVTPDAMRSRMKRGLYRYAD